MPPYTKDIHWESIQIENWDSGGNSCSENLFIRKIIEKSHTQKILREIYKENIFHGIKESVYGKGRWNFIHLLSIKLFGLSGSE